MRPPADESVRPSRSDLDSGRLVGARSALSPCAIEARAEPAPRPPWADRFSDELQPGPPRPSTSTSRQRPEAPADVQPEVIVLRSLFALQAFIPQWKHFLATSADQHTFFQDPEVMLAELDQHPDDCAPYVVVVRKGPEIACIAPGTCTALISISSSASSAWRGFGRVF
jgi:hypothetical protein